MKSIREYLSHLPQVFIDEVQEYGIVKDFPVNTEIIRQGQFVKMIPLVLEGSVKVFTRHEDKELLLYYIETGESCIMSFTAGLKNSPSKVFAVTEEDTLLLLMPSDKMSHWLKVYPSINELFYKLYDQRYSALLDTINHLLYDRLDERLLKYLGEKCRQKGTRILDIRHKQIATDLGTAREVISRIMKKLEQEGKVRQLPNAIKFL